MISAGDVSRLADRDTMIVGFKRIEPGMRGDLKERSRFPSMGMQASSDGLVGVMTV
jgi:hypothetical protein